MNIKAVFIVLAAFFTHPLVYLGLDKMEYSTGNHKINVEYSEGGGLALWNSRLNIDDVGIVTDVYTWGIHLCDKKVTKRTYQLTEAEKHELDTVILDAGVFELNDEYVCKGTVDHPCPTDMGWQVLKFTIDGVEKKVSWNWKVPEKFARIGIKINALKRLHAVPELSPDGFPVWLKLKSKEYKFEKAIRYENQRTFYYLISYNIPDSYKNLYDSIGELLCAPSGGPSGRGDGRCPDFVQELKNATVISREALSGIESAPQYMPNHENTPDPKTVR
jgi:hypothetical protein